MTTRFQQIETLLATEETLDTVHEIASTAAGNILHALLPRDAVTGAVQTAGWTHDDLDKLSRTLRGILADAVEVELDTLAESLSIAAVPGTCGIVQNLR